MRNSLLVKELRADNPTGLKPVTEAKDFDANRDGRGAFLSQRSSDVNLGGAWGRANAGMSSVRHVRNMPTECLRFPTKG